MIRGTKMDDLSQYLINKDANVVEALQRIDLNSKGLLFVVDQNQVLEGVITDGDIRRWLIRTGNLKGKIESFLNRTPYVMHQRNIQAARKKMDEKQITAIPVVDDGGRLYDIIFYSAANKKNESDAKSLKGVSVIIMAGGKGTRLYPYTKILPKPLIPIGDIPIMERIIRRFSETGIDSFYATVNYRANMIKAYFAEQNYNLQYVDENEPLGTAGSLRLIHKKFERPVIVTNCDILINANYQDIYEYHMKSGNELTIVSALKNITVPYGVLQTGQNGTVKGLEEKPQLSYFVNTGMYILDPKLLEEIPKDTFYHMTDLINMLIEKNRVVGMYPVSEDSFLDMGEFEEMHRMEQKLNLKSE